MNHKKSEASPETVEGKSGDILALLEGQRAITTAGRLMLENYCRRWRVSAFHALLATEVLEESQLADALAAGLGIDRLYAVTSLRPAEEAIKAIGFRRAREWEVMAFVSELVAEGEDGTVHVDVAFADPTQYDRIDVLRRELKCEFNLSVAERSDIVSSIDELFPLAEQLPSLFGLCKY